MTGYGVLTYCVVLELGVGFRPGPAVGRPNETTDGQPWQRADGCGHGQDFQSWMSCTGTHCATRVLVLSTEFSTVHLRQYWLSTCQHHAFPKEPSKRQHSKWNNADFLHSHLPPTLLHGRELSKREGQKERVHTSHNSSNNKNEEK